MNAMKNTLSIAGHRFVKPHELYTAKTGDFDDSLIVKLLTQSTTWQHLC